MICSLCYSDDECGCQAWMDYWHSLNDEQRAAEIKMMDDYTAATAAEGAMTHA